MAINMKPQPHTTIGARQLVDCRNSYSGWLRRQGKLERMLAGVFNLIKVKWRQRFVVMVDGSMYVFKDETATPPIHACSLADYNVIKRAIEGPEPVSRVPWCFVLQPLTTTKAHYFASTCQRDMDAWMGKFKQEMMKAHSVPIPSESKFSGGDYTFLEAPVIREPTPKPPQTTAPKKAKPAKPAKTTKPAKPAPQVHDDDDDYYDDTDDDDDYFEIDPDEMDQGARNMPLPAIPKNSPRAGKKADAQVTKHLRKKEKPPVGFKPTVAKPGRTRTLSSGSYMYNSNDKDAAAQVLEKIRSPGVFLVRKSRKSDNQEVLAVNTWDGVKEYQIFETENKKSLDKSLKFSTVEKLVEYYQTHDLPTQPIKLSKSYSLVDLSAQ